MNTNTLNKVQDAGVIFNLIQGIKDTDQEVFIWRFVGGEKHLGLVRLEALRKSRGDFSIVPAPGQDRIVQELLGSLNYIDLYVPGYSLLLRCTIKQTDAPFRYYLKIPDFVAQMERRQSFRLNVQEDAEVRVNFGKMITAHRPTQQHFSKSCFDISTGGFSFYVSRAEAKFFQVQDQLKEVQIKAGDWTSLVNSEVTSIQELDPDEYNGLSYKVWRVSCRFAHIDQVSRKYLEKYIFERIKDELHVING